MNEQQHPIETNSFLYTSGMAINIAEEFPMTPDGLRYLGVMMPVEPVTSAA